MKLDTDTNHFYITVASICTIWMLMCYPLIYKISNTWTPSSLAFLVWVIGIPLTMFITKSYKASLNDDEELFVIAKILSVVMFIVVLHVIFMVNMNLKTFGLKKINNKIVNVVLYLILAANILEAVITQLSNYSEGKNPFDLANGILGILLIVWLPFDAYIKKSGMNILTNGSSQQLMCNFNLLYILAYTLWNLLFRSELFKNSSVLLFFGVSLLLPIISHLTGYGDWLQVRAYTLLALMILTWGIGPGEYRIFPQYNDDGYDPEDDQNSIWTSTLNQDWYKYTTVSVGFICMFLAFFFSVFNVIC